MTDARKGEQNPTTDETRRAVIRTLGIRSIARNLRNAEHSHFVTQFQIEDNRLEQDFGIDVRSTGTT